MPGSKRKRARRKPNPPKRTTSARTLDAGAARQPRASGNAPSKGASGGARRWSDEVGKNAVGSLVASVIFALLPQLTPLPVEWLVPMAGVAFVIGVALLIPALRRMLRAHKAWSTAGVGLCLCIALVAANAWWDAGRVKRLVEEYAAGVCSDGMWIGRQATCYELSEEHIARSFDAYDPNDWHGWDEVRTVATPLLDFSPDGPRLAGKDLLTLGIVTERQDLGGTITIQLRPLQEREAAQIDLDHLAQLAGGEEAARQLLAETIQDNARTDHLIYCNLPPRPYFDVVNGQALAIKGTLLANGLIGAASDGKPFQVSYVTCSSAEHALFTGA